MIAPSTLQATVQRRIDAGARLACIFADRVGADNILYYVIEENGNLQTLSGPVFDAVRSLAVRVPAAAWYEREISERWNVRFENLPPSRPLTIVAPAEQLRVVESSEVSTLLYGPIRSGIVESVRWVVETAGEDFISVYPSMWLKHRGLEARFVNVPIALAPYVAEHVSGASASSHAAAFCKTTEILLGIEAPERARAARAILVELERIHQHLDSLAKLAEDASLSVGSAQVFAAKERVHRLLCETTGNRFARGTICVGGTRFDVFECLREVCSRELDDLQERALSAIDRLISTQSFMDRLIGTGTISHADAAALGGVGPTARGSGVSCDARTGDGYLFTPLDFREALEGGCDAAARTLVRVAEIRRSFQLVRNALDADPRGSYRTSFGLSDGEAIARVESPQGELLYFVRIDSGAIARVAVRGASFANWPLFVPSLRGNIFTDFSFIEHSFGALQSEVDR